MTNYLPLLTNLLTDVHGPPTSSCPCTGHLTLRRERASVLPPDLGAERPDQGVDT